MTRKNSSETGKGSLSETSEEDTAWSETLITEAIHEANQIGCDPADYVRARGDVPKARPTYLFRTIYLKQRRRGILRWFRRPLQESGKDPGKNHHR